MKNEARFARLSSIDRKHRFDVRNTFPFGFWHKEHGVQKAQQTKTGIEPEGSLGPEHFSEGGERFAHNKGENQIHHGDNATGLTAGTRREQFTHQNPRQRSPSDSEQCKVQKHRHKSQPRDV